MWLDTFRQSISHPCRDSLSSLAGAVKKSRPCRNSLIFLSPCRTWARAPGSSFSPDPGRSKMKHRVIQRESTKAGPPAMMWFTLDHRTARYLITRELTMIKENGVKLYINRNDTVIISIGNRKSKLRLRPFGFHYPALGIRFRFRRTVFSIMQGSPAFH